VDDCTNNRVGKSLPVIGSRGVTSGCPHWWRTKGKKATLNSSMEYAETLDISLDKTDVPVGWQCCGVNQG